MGFNSARRKKAKHWTQNQFTNRMYNWKCSKRFIPPPTDGMICFYSNIGLFWIQSNFQETKKEQQQQQQQQKSLYKEHTFAPRVFHSVSVRTLTERNKQTQAIRDAQKLAQNVFRLERLALTSRSLQSIMRPFQKRFREVFGNARILIFYLSIKAWEEKSFRMFVFSVWWR